MDKNLIRKIYQATETKQAEGEERTLIVKISTKNPDRSKDIVEPKGVITNNYVKNPVVSAFHNYKEPAIGKTLDLQVNDDGIVAKVQFVPEGVYSLADTLYKLYKDGFMNAWSIGFMPIEWMDKEDGGRQYNKWELLEYSAVLVPDNPEALTLLRSKGVDVDKLLETEKPKEKKDEDKKPKEEIKEGRVLSEKNRSLISSAITQMKEAMDALDALLQATEASPDDGKSQELALPLVEALKVADKVIGIALRDYKGKGELGKVPDDSRKADVNSGKGGEK